MKKRRARGRVALSREDDFAGRRASWPHRRGADGGPRVNQGHGWRCRAWDEGATGSGSSRTVLSAQCETVARPVLSHRCHLTTSRLLAKADLRRGLNATACWLGGRRLAMGVEGHLDEQRRNNRWMVAHPLIFLGTWKAQFHSFEGGLACQRAQPVRPASRLQAKSVSASSSRSWSSSTGLS